MSQRYLYESDENDPHRLPSLEVFYMSQENLIDCEWLDGDGDPQQPGWYWWSSFPGCLPDGDPYGPFESEDAALEDDPYGPFESEDAALEDARQGLEDDLQEDQT